MLIFCLAFMVVEFFLQFCDFLLNKSYKTYLGTMLPPSKRNWQLISPHYIPRAWAVFTTLCFRYNLRMGPMFVPRRDIQLNPIFASNVGAYLSEEAPVGYSILTHKH